MSCGASSEDRGDAEGGRTLGLGGRIHVSTQGRTGGAGAAHSQPPAVGTPELTGLQELTSVPGESRVSGAPVHTGGRSPGPAGQRGHAHPRAGDSSVDLGHGLGAWRAVSTCPPALQILACRRHTHLRLIRVSSVFPARA